MKPKHLSYQSLFASWRLQLGVVFGVVIYFWALFFLPESALAWITTRIEIAGKVLAPVLPLLGTSAISVLFLFLLSDPMTQGRSSAALFYREQFPSKTIAARFNIDAGLASDYFLRYYDCWQFDSEPEHLDYIHTTQLRFWCLFVHVARGLLVALLVLSVLILGYSFYVQAEGGQLLAQIIFVGVLSALLTAVFVFNRLPSSNKPEVSGCWRAWREQCERNYRMYIESLGNDSPAQFHERNRTRYQGLLVASKAK